jgi:hypothetical protein
MTKGEWAGVFGGVAGLAFAAQAVVWVTRGVVVAVAAAPLLVKLALAAGAASLVLAFLQAGEDEAKASRRA